MKRTGWLGLAVLVLAVWCGPAGAGEVTIKRDGYGVPHVYADTVFYGFGYAIARDRLFQIDMVRYSGQGRVAEVLGSLEATVKALEEEHGKDMAAWRIPAAAGPLLFCTPPG